MPIKIPNNLPARAVLATPGRCLRADLLAPFGEPVAYPCGRCDRCVGATA